MTEETKLSEQTADIAKQLGQTIGTMLVTKAYYEHDGVDTTAIDSQIEQLKNQMKRTVTLQRKYKKREEFQKILDDNISDLYLSDEE